MCRIFEWQFWLLTAVGAVQTRAVILCIACYGYGWTQIIHSRSSKRTFIQRCYCVADSIYSSLSAVCQLYVCTQDPHSIFTYRLGKLCHVWKVRLSGAWLPFIRAVPWSVCKAAVSAVFTNIETETNREIYIVSGAVAPLTLLSFTITVINGLCSYITVIDYIENANSGLYCASCCLRSKLLFKNLTH